ncbi:MAG: serine/threonine-protein kinase [Gaiellaceae bacterium]
MHHLQAGTPDLRPGDTLGPYRLDAVLGEGSMGIVFRAERTSDGTVVALKVLRRMLSRDPVYKQRFLREVRVASEVRHRHLVPIHEAGEADGYDYLAVSCLSGGTLGDRVEAEGPLPVADCVVLAAEIGAGLDALHAHAIVHRDVKPSNIMLDEAGRAALTDFGLAKGRAYTVLTKPGQMMGTLDYIAPELVRGEQAGPASDIYGLGCVVYEALTGAPPFGGRRASEVAVAHLEQEPPDPRTVRPELPPDVGRIVLAALAKTPRDRPRTGAAFAHLLGAAAGQPRA